MPNRNEPPDDPLAELLDRMIGGGRAAAAEVAQAREYAERLVNRMLPLGMAPRRLLLANVREEMLEAVSQRLRDEARSRRHARPRETLRLAGLAVEAAEGMGEEDEERDRRAQALAEALTERGNARRLVGDLAGAERDFAKAGWLLNEHGGDSLAEAELLSLRACLETDRRHFAKAIELADEACSLYAYYGQVSGALSSLIQLGALHGYAGRHEEGIDTLGCAVELAVDLGDAKDLLHVANNVAFLFAEAGLAADAAAVVDLARELCDQVGTRRDGLRLDWLSARIRADQGHHAAATIILSDLRAAYTDDGLPHEAALVSLELALAFARQGRRVELRHLAEETAEAFRLLGVEREAIGALALLAQADAEEAAELTARLAAAVRRARRHGEA